MFLHLKRKRLEPLLGYCEGVPIANIDLDRNREPIKTYAPFEDCVRTVHCSTLPCNALTS